MTTEPVAKKADTTAKTIWVTPREASPPAEDEAKTPVASSDDDEKN